MVYYKVSGKIIEMIVDDEGKIIILRPKIGNFKVEEVSYVGFVECSNGGSGSECENDADCEELLPPFPPYNRKCVKDGNKCICQYIT